jgi:hypothetical protein
VRNAGELERLQHRLDVLLLVLGDESEDEAVPEERVARIEGDPVEEVEAVAAHVLDERAGLAGAEERERRTAVTGLLERVVDLVELGLARVLALELAAQPQLLEVADVGEIPDERRLERRELARQLVVRERCEQRFGPPARVLEDDRELRP